MVERCSAPHKTAYIRHNVSGRPAIALPSTVEQILKTKLFMLSAEDSTKKLKFHWRSATVDRIRSSRIAWTTKVVEFLNTFGILKCSKIEHPK